MSDPVNASSLAPPDLARFIDHTILTPEASRDDITRVCGEARQYGFFGVCVNSANVALAARLLSGSSLRVVAVVGFPLSAASPAAKAFEARGACHEGAGEIDMVMNIGALKGRDYKAGVEDIAQVVAASAQAPVKVILEMAKLTADEKIIGCALAKAGGAAFVKTSTGFNVSGATVDDVALMRRIVGPEMGVKASGGIRSADDARQMIAAGASRIGASQSVAIVTGH